MRICLGRACRWKSTGGGISLFDSWDVWSLSLSSGGRVFLCGNRDAQHGRLSAADTGFSIFQSRGRGYFVHVYRIGNQNGVGTAPWMVAGCVHLCPGPGDSDAGFVSDEGGVIGMGANFVLGAGCESRHLSNPRIISGRIFGGGGRVDRSLSRLVAGRYQADVCLWGVVAYRAHPGRHQHGEPHRVFRGLVLFVNGCRDARRIVFLGGSPHSFVWYPHHP